MKENDRISVIDVAKGIGIVLVIIGHTLPSDNLIRIFVYTFHMPLFFILAGMVMKVSRDKKSILEDFFEERKLIGDYCFYSILFIIFDVIVRFFVQREISLNELIWGIYQTVVLYGINVLWFLPTLVLAKVLVKWICGISSKRIYALIIGSAFYVVGGMLSTQIQWLNVGKYRLIYYPLIALLRAVSVAIYILLGYIMREKIKEYSHRTNIDGSAICVAIFATLLLLMIFNLAGNVDIHVMRMGEWYIAFVCAVLGTIMVLGVSILLDKVKGVGEWLRYMGINSLFIMVTHSYLEIPVIINWFLQNFNLLSCRNIALLQIALLCVVECIICKLCFPYVKRAKKCLLYRKGQE